MKRITVFCLIMVFALTVCACAALSPATAPAPAAPAASAAPIPTAEPEPTPVPYAYVTAQELYALLGESGENVLLVDLQPLKYYAAGHIQASVSTEAYPANDEKLLAKLDTLSSDVQSADMVVLIDMAGKAGAHNAFDHLAASGADASKLRILEGGMMAWTYPDLTETVPDAYEYQKMSAKDVRRTLRSDGERILIDLRSFDEYELLHIKESVNVPATLGDAGEAAVNASLAKALPVLAQSASAPVILITGDGGADAEAYYDYFARHSVSPARLFILEGGVNAWPEDYKHYVVASEGADVGKGTESTEQEAPEALLEALPENAQSLPQQDTQYYG